LTVIDQLAIGFG